MVIKATTKVTSDFPKLNKNIINPCLWYNKTFLRERFIGTTAYIEKPEVQ